MNEPEEVVELIRNAMKKAGYEKNGRIVLADNLGDFGGLVNSTGPVIHEFYPKWSFELLYPIGIDERSKKSH